MRQKSLKDDETGRIKQTFKAAKKKNDRQEENDKRKQIVRTC